MQQQTVLLSGATGFLGSHLAKDLLNRNYKILALVRKSSDRSRCLEITDSNFVFVDTDSANYKELIRQYSPSAFIHLAWGGVSAAGRNDWTIQVQNIDLTIRYLEVAKELNIKKILSFGSQAEYGNFNGRIKETAVCRPLSAYGAAKMAALYLMRSFCETNSIRWFWLRLFSIYGTDENPEWLIPSIIRNTSNNKPMDLTGCEQRYDYLYTKDFSEAVDKVLGSDADSGVFNLSSNASMQLKELIEKIRNMVNPESRLNFGALPYRPNQVMHMEGDSSKFNEQFGFKVATNFDTNIREVVEHYLAKNKS